MNKPTILSSGLILVEVPKDANDFWINNCGCIRYSCQDGKVSSVIEPTSLGFYAKKEKHEIIGTITKDECSFNCSNYVLKSLNKFGTAVLYNDYTDILNEFLNPLDRFKSMIEAETDFRFESPCVLYDNLFDRKLPFIEQINNANKKVEELKSKVVEKLVVLKEVKL